MTSSDHFAKWYASVTDDVRHHVVERGWYGREISGNEMSQDVERTIDAHNSDLSRSAWGQLPEAEQSEAWENVPNADLCGEPATSEDGFYGNTHAPGAESQDLYGYDATQRAEMDEFYGSKGRPEPSPSDLYGEASQSADASDFYGNGPSHEPEASDFYGEPEQDLEQEL